MTRDSDYSHTINRHYGAADLSARIFERLRAAGKDPATITRDELATFDEFHTGGRESTTTANTLDHARRRRPPPPRLDAAPALGRDTIVLEDVAHKIENAVRNLEGERIVTVRAVLRRADPSTRARA